MQGNNEDNFAQIREEHIKRVEALYESKAKNFRNLFGGSQRAAAKIVDGEGEKEGKLRSDGLVVT